MTLKITANWLMLCPLSDELLLPHMKRVDGMITDNRRRLLPKLRMGQLFKVGLVVSALESEYCDL